MQKEYSLLENYEWFGTFWFETEDGEDSPPDEQFSGKLYYDPTKGIKLEIMLSENHYLSFEQKYKDGLHHILGVVDDINGIQHVSLYKCLCRPAHHSSGIAGKISIICYSLVIGSKYFSRDFLFVKCNTKYRYMPEFIKYRNNSNLDNIFSFKVNNEINADISPQLKILNFPSFIMKQGIDETNEEYEIRKNKVEQLQSNLETQLSELKASVKNSSTEDTYICSLYRDDKQLENFNTLIKSVDKVKNVFSLLLCKSFYVEQIHVVYNIKNQSDGSTYESNAFVFHYINSLSKDELNNIPEVSTMYSPQYGNPFSIDSIDSNKVTEFAKLINNEDNSMLISYMLFYIKKELVYDYEAKERFILAMSLLEREYNNLCSDNNKDDKKYDIVIEKYANEQIFNIFLYILTNSSIDTDTIKLNDILKTSNTYYMGTILSFFRNTIVHNDNNNLGGMGCDTPEKKALKKKYQNYWSTNVYILTNITQFTSVLLFIILYSKIDVNKTTFDDIVDRLLTKHYGSEQYRENNIRNSIENSTKLTDKLNS